MSSPDGIKDLEIKLTHLEKHVEEQDKVMLGLSRQMERLRVEISLLRQKLQESGDSPTAQTGPEKPPHY